MLFESGGGVLVSKRTGLLLRSAQAAFLIFGTLWASTVLAQIATSNLIGTVVDASTKAPIADVVVTATAPTLQGEQVVVTDATGTYRVPQLPPGVYTLRFEKETYRPFSRSAALLIDSCVMTDHFFISPRAEGRGSMPTERSSVTAALARTSQRRFARVKPRKR